MPTILRINESKNENYGQVPGCDALIELVEPVAAEAELEEQLDWEPPELVDKMCSNTPSTDRNTALNPVLLGP